MRQIIGYFFKVRKELLVLLVLAILIYFTIELYLNKYKELFIGASKIGEFCSKLSISYISAFIFYFIVVHIKAEKDKENINEFVGHKVYSIIASAHLLIQPLQQKFDQKARFEDLKIAGLRKLLDSVERNAEEAPYVMAGKNTSWLIWYEYLRESTLESFKEIFIRYNHLDSNLIKLLTRLQDSLFFTQWNMLYDFRYDNTFGIYEIQIKTYLKLIGDLEEYADKNFKKHQFKTSEFIGFKPSNYK